MSGRHKSKRKKRNGRNRPVQELKESSGTLPENTTPKYKLQNEAEKMRIFKKPESIWTIAGVGLAFIVAVIYFLQFRAMRDAVDSSDRNMRIDQRAWLRVRETIPDATQLPIGMEIPEEVEIVNIGKTPARHINVKIASGVLASSIPPDFTYVTGEEFILDINGPGIMMPNDPVQIPFIIRRDPGRERKPQTKEVGQPLTNTQKIIETIKNGNAYIEVHGYVTYNDIFGTYHWVNFCAAAGSRDFHYTDASHKCREYNDVDNNQ